MSAGPGINHNVWPSPFYLTLKTGIGRKKKNEYDEQLCKWLGNCKRAVGTLRLIYGKEKGLGFMCHLFVYNKHPSHCF